MVLSTNYITMYESCTSVLELTNMMVEHHKELSDELYENSMEAKSHGDILNEASVNDIAQAIIKFITKWAANIGAAVKKFFKSFAANLRVLAGKIRASQNTLKSDAFEDIDIVVNDIRNIPYIFSKHFNIIEGQSFYDMIEKPDDGVKYVDIFVNDAINDLTNGKPELYQDFLSLFDSYFPKMQLTSEFMSLSQCSDMVKTLGKINGDILDLSSQADRMAANVRREMESLRRTSERDKKLSSDNTKDYMRLMSNLDIAINKILTFNTRVVDYRLRATKNAQDIVVLVTNIWSGNYTKAS